jgi:hypothetical protein
MDLDEIWEVTRSWVSDVARDDDFFAPKALCRAFRIEITF